jgi:hypothetical protein
MPADNLVYIGEHRFVLPKGYPNKTIVYFEYEVEGGYEYAVGKTTASANPTAVFSILYWARRLSGRRYGEYEFSSED